MAVKFEWTGDGLAKMERAIELLGSEKAARSEFRSAINSRGSLLRKDAVRILPRQTGLGKATISKALGKPIRASNSRLTYILTTRGGFISYKYFAPIERSRGVFAYPRSEAFFIDHGFLFGGRQGARKPLPMNGHVFAPNGRAAGKKSKWTGADGNMWGRGFSKQVSDVRIPEEMVRDDMEAAAEKHAKALEPDILDRIKKLTGNIF